MKMNKFYSILLAIFITVVTFTGAVWADGFEIGGEFTVTCYAPDGTVKWVEKTHNVITDEGLDHILDVVLHNATQTSTWYVGIKNTGSGAAADTMSSHTGWTENANYDELTRPAYVEAAASSQSTTNSASEAEFTIDTNTQTIAGAFLSSDNTKSGTSGTLLCVADFSASQSADDNDVLKVTYTISAADN